MTTYERIKELCEKEGFNVSNIGTVIPGLSVKKASVTGWKNGSKPRPEKLKAIAEYFGVSVDYLLGRTNDPLDYDTNGDALAEIPLTYVEAANGDMKRARAIMLAAERDAQREAQLRSGKLSRFSPQDSDLIFALWGDTDDVDEKDLEDVKRFAAFIKEKKKDK